jgi:biotin operon repressor
VSPAGTKIIHALGYGPQTVQELGRLTGLSYASVKRTVQELRTEGHNISFANANGGPYALGTPTNPETTS